PFPLPRLPLAWGERGEIDLEPYALSILVAGADGPPVQPRDRRHQRESQTRPGPPAARLIGPIERVEHVRQVGRRDPGAGVLDGDPYAPHGRHARVGMDDDPPGKRREF